MSGWEAGYRDPSKWTVSRLQITLDYLERSLPAERYPGESLPVPGREPKTPEATKYFNLTRSSRRLPTELLPQTFGSLGDRIRFRRLELGLTQRQLAKQLGVGRMLWVPDIPAGDFRIFLPVPWAGSGVGFRHC